MMEVGVREFRDHLRKYLQRAAKGDEVVVTDRGRPLARIVSAAMPSRLERLIAEGVITPPKRPATSAWKHPLIKAKGGVSDLIKEQRR